VAVVKKGKERRQRVNGSWYDAEIVYRRDPRGNLTVQVGAVRYRKRSLRYWRALTRAVRATLRARIRGR
jgi:hypothetical protein